MGFPCCGRISLSCMPSPIPRWDRWVGSLSLGFTFPHQRRRPSPYDRRVGSHITCFEACSAFTRVTACLLAESPDATLLHRRLRRIRYLLRRSDCYRLERPVAGWDLHPLETAVFARHTVRSRLEDALATARFRLITRGPRGIGTRRSWASGRSTGMRVKLAWTCWSGAKAWRMRSLRITAKLVAVHHGATFSHPASCQSSIRDAERVAALRFPVLRFLAS